MGKIFGTDGARGVAGTELTVELAVNIGRAAAKVVREREGKRPLFVIGKDTRISSDLLEQAVAAGICSMGGDVLLLGVLPTPAVAYLIGFCHADAGVMISASHNPYEYNGIKLFGASGFKLTDAQEEEIETLLENSDCLKQGCASGEMGRVRRAETAYSDYVRHVVSTAGGSLSGLRVAVDCANGSASRTAKELFESLGARYTILSAEPDGININRNCGSTHLEQLAKTVREGDFDLGVAFDGDADRCLAVDEHGELLDGDGMLSIFGSFMKERGALKKDTVVVTVMSNLGLFHFARDNGLSLETTKVGDRYVLENMLAGGFNLGGENSGHIIFLDHMTTGDGELSAVQLMRVMRETGKPLSELASAMKKCPQVMLGVHATPAMKAALSTCEPVRSYLDAYSKKLGDRGRILVRPSGTEPLIRVMVEGQDAAEIETAAREIAETIEKHLA